MTQIALNDPYCGYLVLIFGKIEEFHFLLGISKKVFDLFNIRSADRNFIFFVLSETFTFVDEQYQKILRI